MIQRILPGGVADALRRSSGWTICLQTASTLANAQRTNRGCAALAPKANESTANILIDTCQYWRIRCHHIQEGRRSDEHGVHRDTSRSASVSWRWSTPAPMPRRSSTPTSTWCSLA